MSPAYLNCIHLAFCSSCETSSVATYPVAPVTRAVCAIWARETIGERARQTATRELLQRIDLGPVGTLRKFIILRYPSWTIFLLLPI